jgi:hypothetical protein
MKKSCSALFSGLRIEVKCECVYVCVSASLRIRVSWFMYNDWTLQNKSTLTVPLSYLGPLFGWRTEILYWSLYTCFGADCALDKFKLGAKLGLNRLFAGL